MNSWIPVEERLPEENVWVIVLENDLTDPVHVFWNKKKGIADLRATPARMLGMDSDGFPVWYLCYGGSHPIYHVRNVTHWREIEENFHQLSGE